MVKKRDQKTKQNKNVTLMGLETFVNLICILLKL